VLPLTRTKGLTLLTISVNNTGKQFDLLLLGVDVSVSLASYKDRATGARTVTLKLYYTVLEIVTSVVFNVEVPVTNKGFKHCNCGATSINK
jgi:hypothetical protein